MDGALTSTWLVALCQKSIDALNLYGQLRLDNVIPIPVVWFITILQNIQKRIMFYHDGLIEFKMNRYFSKSDEIHLGLRVT